MIPKLKKNTLNYSKKHVIAFLPKGPNETMKTENP